VCVLCVFVAIGYVFCSKSEMPPPPPPGPPPPPAPPPPGPPKLGKTEQNSRGALLNQINNGQPKLKSAKHLMNDRSGPSIEGKKSEGGK
jgi:WAS/WASL-interacting protein